LIFFFSSAASDDVCSVAAAGIGEGVTTGALFAY